MAKASIKNMMFYGFHGVYEYEREQGQKFFLDVTCETKNDRVVESDAIEDGVDIAAVYDIVKDVTENKRFTTLSALGGHIGDKLLKKYPHFAAVTVTTRKPNVPISGSLDYVEVSVTRHAK